jgi:hypothetical protein
MGSESCGPPPSLPVKLEELGLLVRNKPLTPEERQIEGQCEQPTGYGSEESAFVRPWGAAEISISYFR